MKNRNETNVRGTTLFLRVLFLFLPLFALLYAVTTTLVLIREKADLAVVRSKEKQIVLSQAINIDADIVGVASDLAILSQEVVEDRLWSTDGKIDPDALASLERHFLSFSTHRKLYDQIRLLDKHGMEIVRVNFNNGTPTIETEERLQNKKGRYYFEDAYILNQGEVFVSPLDLNIEHGEIEQPLKPMIRFATPVFYPEHEKRGIVLLNYFGATLINRFTDQATPADGAQTMLLNTDGYWLNGPIPDDEWGFMYKTRKNRTFAVKFSEAWKKIQAEETGQFETPKGLFSFRTVYPLLDEQRSSTGAGEAFARSNMPLKAKEYHWKIVSFIPSKILYAPRKAERQIIALLLVFLALATFFALWRIAWAVALRKQATAALIKERLRIKSILSAIEQSAETIVITNTQGLIEYANPAFEKTTGYTVNEAIGKNPRILKSGTHDTAFYKTMWKTLLNGETWSGRFINKKKNGTLYTEDATISPVFDIAGEPVNYVAAKRDITEDLNMEEQFRQAQKMQSIGQLVAGIAHDFNNLMHVINGYAEMAQKKLHPEHAAGKNITQIRKAGEQAANLVKQLLTFSRQQVIEPIELDINELIKSSWKMIRHMIGENIQFEFTAGKDLGSIYVDKGQMQQVLMNLCINARDAMPDGGTLSMKTETRPGNHILLSIHDTGCGMGEETLKKAFEPFFTTKEIGKGTGLGLSTVYGIIKQNKGRIEVTSNLGEGTTFKLHLPRTKNC